MKFNRTLNYRRAGIRPISKKRRSLGTVYRVRRQRFLEENPLCVWGLKQNPPQYIASTQVHHTRGRAGSLLLDTRFWVAVSQDGHDWIHNNMAAARKLGFICQHGHWNTPVPLDQPTQ